MQHLNRYLSCVLVLAFLALSACTNGGGYAPWNQEPPTEAQAAPSSLSSAQVANGPGNINLGTGAQTVTGASAQQQPMTFGNAPDAPAPAPVPAAAMPANAAPIKVAILLPLSGKDAALGNAMLQAAQMALFDIGQNSFELMPRDTAKGARIAAQGAIAEGAKLVLGPLFAADVREAKAVTQSAGINMISFSTDWTLAGGNTFIMGFLPFDQIDRVVSYASSHGLRHIGVIAPNSQYGNAVISSWRAKVGTQVVPSDIASMPASSAALPATVQSFVQQSVVPFDAVLMPVGGTTAGQLGDLFTQNGLPPERVKRLGTGLWEDATLASAAGLQNGWFAAPMPEQRAKFEGRYNSLYGTTPPRLASLAYDATALAAVLARQGDFNRNAIVNPNGFTGIDGIFRFRNDGLAERGLAVLELKGGKINVVDPAPRTFQH